MSTFTRGIRMEPVRVARRGLARLLPPGLARPAWVVAERFDYAVGSLEKPSHIITVPEGFRFDGASVPLLLRPFFPMAHPDYIQAAALHDWLYSTGGAAKTWEGRAPLATYALERLYADRIFREALGVLNMPKHWRWCFYLAVRIGGRSRYLRPKNIQERAGS